MSKYLVVTFSDGKRFGIPAEVVARDRARHYAKLDSDRGDGTYYEVLGAEFEYAIEDAYELTDWAANNMNWSAVSAYAHLLPDDEANKPDYEKEWTNAKMEVK